MRRLGSLLLVVSSIAAYAELRPRYGGTLRVQILSMFPNPETLPLVAETLVRLNERGDVVPCLARSWQSDAAKKRWRFLLRSNGVTPEAAVSALRPLLKKSYSDVAVAPVSQSVAIQSEHPMPDLLERLANSDAGVPGTGPFRVSKWEPGRRLVLEANEDYAGGRPFVDTVEFTVSPQRTLQLTSAELWELPVGISRRSIPDGMRVWTSTPLELVALSLANPDPALRDALSLSIDRTAIVNVLMQRRGEVAYGLLPQSLSGYEFLFAAPFDANRARDAAAAFKTGALTISAPASDPLAKMVADRIIVNARDAGLVLQIAPPGAAADIQVLHLGPQSFGGRLDRSSPEGSYRSERAILDEGRLIPLIHVPQVFGIGARVHMGGGAALPASGILNAIPNMWLDK